LQLSPSITISTTIRSLEEGNQDKQAVLLFFFSHEHPYMKHADDFDPLADPGAIF